MKRFDIISLFPKTVEAYMQASILGRAQEKQLLTIQAHDLRPFSNDKHGKVDDTPYGGGPGMVMTVQPIDAAIRNIRDKKKKTRIILTSASGKQFTQQDAKRLAEYDQIVFICGRYEGVDARVEEHIADEALSIGNFVLTGGELPAMVMTDAIARLVPGVLGDQASLEEESHSQPGILEYPQYTKPANYPFKTGLIKKETLSVPDILLSGNHAKIASWRKEQSQRRSQDNAQNK